MLLQDSTRVATGNTPTSARPVPKSLVGTYLETIIEDHLAMTADRLEPIEELAEKASAAAEGFPIRGFAESIRSTAGTGIGVIAEVKRRTPTDGILRADVDVATRAADYARGGAVALSVLTDEAHFDGSAGDLRAARAATDLPTLRKDFTVREHDIYAARIMGADAVLLIVAAFDDDDELHRFSTIASSLDMDALFEVHDELELNRAIDAGARLIGVNQRNLHTFEVDHARALRMVEEIPSDVVRVAESGVRGKKDAQDLAEAGYHAILVGRYLMHSENPAGAVRTLSHRV
ncbi:MAG TPA: indole-3-glycerol-phosphate synthase TrpC [Acidimicrobiaceae bacterium]|nr:indole-3-glycerol-phosphate synthase TrpC [Acidimicrobiaceae bacterium]HCB37391.1 indole-3-glycerol-phosphate synthase TrpC [Acidimicrobiaceae bacterium]